MKGDMGGRGMNDRHKPTDEEYAAGMRCKNVMRCSICQAPADRYDYGYQCRAHPGHIGDPFVGIFSDLTYPPKGYDAEGNRGGK